MSRAGFREPISADLAIARQMLSDAGLPVAGVTIDHLALVAEQEGAVCGLIGLEQFEQVGLLRSLVIARECRSAGLGSLLVDALEQLAMAQNISELWLLTIDADGWFAKLGYTAQSRELAPAAIQQTEEFSSLCPGDAVLMKKSLSS
jgi:amino-acid N-acetyltransferase